MQELTFEQVEDVNGGAAIIWKVVRKNMISQMGDGTWGGNYPSSYIAPYPGEGLAPY